MTKPRGEAPMKEINLSSVLAEIKAFEKANGFKPAVVRLDKAVYGKVLVEVESLCGEASSVDPVDAELHISGVKIVVKTEALDI